MYDGEDPSHFEGWLDAVQTSLQHDRQKFKKGVDEEVNWSHQGNTFHDECPPGLTMMSSPN